MKSTTLTVGTLVAVAVAIGGAPIAAAQDPGEQVVVAAIQERGYMGVQIAFEDGALVVNGVLPGTPAEQAGLQAGDRILSIGELRAGDQEQVEELLSGTTVGQVLTLHVERGDKHANMRIRLVSLASVQPEAGEPRSSVRRVVTGERPVIVDFRPTSEKRDVVVGGREAESDAVTDRLQSSRVQAISKLRAAARLQTEARLSEGRSSEDRSSEDRSSEAAQEREQRIQNTRLRSTARADSSQERDDAAERRAALRVRASERKARADERREAVAARKRAEDRAAVGEDRAQRKDEARGSAEDRQLQELKRELEGVRAELERLRAEIRRLSREMDGERG